MVLTTFARATRWIPALGLLVAACGGDDGGALIDGAPFPDAGSGDAAIDCYGEANDVGNGVTPEATGLGFGGGHFAICGALDTGHLAGDLLDMDRYRVTISPGGPESIRLISPSGSLLDRIDLRVRDRNGLEVAVARYRAGHAVAALTLPQGEYILVVEGHAGGAIGSAVPYRIDVGPDDPTARCPIAASPPPHLEVDESGAGHRANDVVAVDETPDLIATLTASTADAPDATGAAVSAGGRMAISGLSANVTSTGDDYRDRDTFAIYTGATTNQLDLRATWTGGPADLDVRLFEPGKLDEPMGTPTAALIGEEVTVSAVKPSTAYWIWIGGSTRSTTLPANYTIYVCGKEISPAPQAN